MKKKLTMITVNGVTKFVWATPDYRGKVRVSMKTIDRLFGTKRGDCICIA